MAYTHLALTKHRISLSGQAIALLRDRLIPISPMDYELADFAILRELYGRFDHIVFDDEMEHPLSKGG